MRPLIATGALIAALALAACGGGSGAGNPDSKIAAEQATEPIPGAPPQLAAIRAQGNQILDGGTDAFNARLAELKGTPVVVNQWGSWCGPCRLEFPVLQSVATKEGASVAFLGVLSDDSKDAADEFLSELPLPYPSYDDPDKKIGAELNAQAGLPTTSFYDPSGKLVFTKFGPYTDEAALEADIQTYSG
jgi:cytochrome c biogenesis protein CcmG/thiol:disulfide interchange protein DsbE